MRDVGHQAVDHEEPAGLDLGLPLELQGLAIANLDVGLLGLEKRLELVEVAGRPAARDVFRRTALCLRADVL
ncbi:hypothetical protein [Roseovarius sp. THAF9]|uniref:hypothetical protein n=1 Tax=Roseovarius sp. THAF9 TaxID=2587847 RepID=UPI00156246E1|nr:hypothetical protein [Roseovarius sp. THAF9]